MGKIAVLGGGRQGSLVATTLVELGHEVTVFDAAEKKIDGCETKVYDITAELDNLAIALTQFELVVGALPASLGTLGLEAVYKSKSTFVDVSFYDINWDVVEAKSREAGSFIIPDCGLAPGLSNIFLGRLYYLLEPYNNGKPSGAITVGGISEDSKAPYGYVLSWDPAGLLDEYTRPAKFIFEEKIVEAPLFEGSCAPFSIKHESEEFEIFPTDGCRTLLSTQKDKFCDLVEYTLRRPGHVKAIKPLLKAGTFAQTFSQNCTEGTDRVILSVKIEKTGPVGRDTETLSIDVPGDKTKAMAKVTAFTCAAVADYAVRHNLRAWAPDKGGITPEELGAYSHFYAHIVRFLQRKEIQIVHDFVSKHGELPEDEY